MLRVVCAIAVIVIHVSSNYLQYSKNNILYTCLYNMLSMFAVPCFLMLSGAFILDNKENANYKYFYKKTFKSIAIPTIIFSILYLCFNIFITLFEVLKHNESLIKLISPIKSLIIGEPFYHMWYLYMLIGIYLIAPFVIKFKNDIGESNFKKVSIIFFIVAMISGYTSTHLLAWDIGSSFEYLGYFIIGYTIRKANNKKNNYKALLYAIVGLLLCLLLTFFRYREVSNGIISSGRLKYDLISPMFALIALFSICIFKSFAVLNVNINIGKLSSLTFLIYLFHAGVWYILLKILNKLNLQISNIILIPIATIIVFILSLLLSISYTKIWNFIERKFDVSNKLCKKFRDINVSKFRSKKYM